MLVVVVVLVVVVEVVVIPVKAQEEQHKGIHFGMEQHMFQEDLMEVVERNTAVVEVVLVKQVEQMEVPKVGMEETLI